jgi:hypothetical protein
MECPSGSWQHQLTCFVGVIAEPSHDIYMIFIQVVVPLLAVIAATLVAIASWRTARRATQIADQALTSELEREARDQARRDDEHASEYQLRLDERIVLLIEAMGVYVGDVNTWLIEVERLQDQTHLTIEEVDAPRLPSSAIVYTSMQGAMLFARGDDRQTLQLVDDYIREVLRTPKTSQWKTDPRVRYLAELLRQWRDTTVTRTDFEKQIADARDTIHQNHDNPDPTTARRA